jgi:hypothetical protein
MRSHTHVFIQGLLREALVWRQLRHPNVLIFVGLQLDSDTPDRLSRTAFSLVSAWMTHGSLLAYLQKPRYNAALHRLPLVRAIVKAPCWDSSVGKDRRRCQRD